MCNSELLKIDLKEIEQGLSVLEFNLGDAWFQGLDDAEVKCGDICLSVKVRRTENYFELDFHMEGKVIVPCDICLDDMEQPICCDNRLVAKFGEEYSEDDDLVTVAENDGVLDLTWFIYEFIALNIPIKHVHAPGKCNAAMIKALEEHSATRSSGGDDTEDMDPRWSELKKLKNNN